VHVPALGPEYCKRPAGGLKLPPVLCTDMSVTGLCELCQRPDVEESCDRCGRLVCDRHFDDSAGVCVDCSDDIGGSGERIDPENLPDGVDTYQF